MKLAPHANQFGAFLKENSSVKVVFVWVCIRACICMCARACVCVCVWVSERERERCSAFWQTTSWRSARWLLLNSSNDQCKKHTYWRLLLEVDLGFCLRSWCEMSVHHMVHQHITPKEEVMSHQQEVMLIAFSTPCVWCTMTWPFRMDIEFCFLCWISEAFEVYHSVEEWKNNLILHRNCTLLHLPCYAAVFDEEPNLDQPQPPYSWDLTSCDFQLLLMLKIRLVGNQFVSVEKTQQKVTYFCHTTRDWGASSNDRIARASMYMQMGSTLRVTGLGFIHILLTTNNAWVPGTYWSFHI